MSYTAHSKKNNTTRNAELESQLTGAVKNTMDRGDGGGDKEGEVKNSEAVEENEFFFFLYIKKNYFFV
jgi:hypothetical protein